MNTFVAVRYGLFALFILFAGLIGSFSALNLGFMNTNMGTNTKRPPMVQSLDLYLAILSIANMVFIFPVIGIEIVRKGAITSRIWFEHIWVAFFSLAYLMGAIAATMLLPKALCPPGKTNTMACFASVALIAFMWTISSLYFIYFLTLLVYTLVHSQSCSNIWTSTITDRSSHPQELPPVVVSQSYSQSIDSPTKLINVHPMKTETDSPGKDEEKAVVVILPTLNKNGPPTFGAGYTFPQRSGVTPNASSNRYARDMGVNAINGAPSYDGRPQQNGGSSMMPYQFQAHPYRKLQSAQDTPDSAMSSGHVKAPWSNESQTPSPAVVKQAAKVTPIQQSLYPAHVVNAGLDVRNLVPQPTQQKAPVVGNLVDLLRAAGLSQGRTPLPNDPSSRVSQRSSDMSSPSARGHGQAQSVDSFVQVSLQSPSNGTPMRTSNRRSMSLGDTQLAYGRRGRPMRRPPPLNLTGLSNIARADAR
ncbi:hypothetical protein FRC16_010991 [Serendipita sp. 398]|nr:hypothetical protein FRC16_010991 [Serendipita sp. 398]